MLSKKQYKLFVQHPTGKIPQNAFCEQCCRLNLRHSTVEAIILDNKNNILLVKRASNPQAGWWALAGGYVDWNETLEQAVKREVKEETGLDAVSTTFFRVFDNIQRDLDGRQNIGHCYIVVCTGEEQRQREEIDELKWFSLYSLPENMAFDHKEMIEEYKKTR